MEKIEYQEFRRDIKYIKIKLKKLSERVQELEKENTNLIKRYELDSYHIKMD